VGSWCQLSITVAGSGTLSENGIPSSSPALIRFKTSANDSHSALTPRPLTSLQYSVALLIAPSIVPSRATTEPMQVVPELLVLMSISGIMFISPPTMQHRHGFTHRDNSSGKLNVTQESREFSE